ncbi:hypothetical protein [Chryseobacterium sp. JV558]|uniref:hypothetical protein n=1 Tax=Chryseobacterium sp. JV558 TaxID=2663236 RepID=UPI00299F2165|nr:hypothetical protein [Chryseobacterium sp. JV558]MDW9381996.1 hypothetical protein [Chryseobacterium sp. JV558]
MKKLLLLLFVAIATTTFAQNKINIESGNFDFLKDQTEVNVQFKFEKPLFQADNYTEAQYLERRKAETLAKKGEESWKEWDEEWQKHKESVFLDRFIQGLNGKAKKIKFSKGVTAKYTLILDTKWIYAGWTGFVTQPAKLSSELIFVETENPSKVLAKIQGDKIEGIGSKVSYHMEYGRISAAYEKTGKELGKAIKSALK